MNRPWTPVLLAGMLVATLLPAQPAPGCMGPGGGPPPMGGPGPGRPGPPLFGSLDLTADQQKAIKAIMDGHRPALMARHRILEDKGAAAREGMENPALPEARLRALVAAEDEARLQVLLEERAGFLEAYALLTPGQKAKAQRLNEKRRKEWAAHREVLDEEGSPAK